MVNETAAGAEAVGHAARHEVGELGHAGLAEINAPLSRSLRTTKASFAAR